MDDRGTISALRAQRFTNADDFLWKTGCKGSRTKGAFQHANIAEAAAPYTE
jgi:hypothetical protein